MISLLFLFTRIAPIKFTLSAQLRTFLLYSTSAEQIVCSAFLFKCSKLLALSISLSFISFLYQISQTELQL